MSNLEERLVELVSILSSTPSPVSVLRHHPDRGIPHFYYEAGGSHEPPYSEEEMDAIVEAKKLEAASADEVFTNLFLGNKAAAEDTDYLTSKKITHVLNLASNTDLKLHVVPDHESLKKQGIELKELKLRDKPDENITSAFCESGRWIRRSLESGGRVMVNCWQGASRSATVVLAFLMMHHNMELSAVLAQVKTRRDIRPNNGFLKQLVTLENILNQGIYQNLESLLSKTGQEILKDSEKEGLSNFNRVQKYFGQQTCNTFCGVQSSCIVLNSLIDAKKYSEGLFWGPNLESIVEEAVVQKKGMTLAQLRDILNTHDRVHATATQTDELPLEEFRKVLSKSVGGSGYILINYHMSVLGQLAGLSGHISPLAAYCKARDMALLMDVWWETRPVWVRLPDLWDAMDQVDPTSGKKRGFVLVEANID